MKNNNQTRDGLLKLLTASKSACALSARRVQLLVPSVAVKLRTDIWNFVLSGVLALFLAGCASGPKAVDHAFGFDAVHDSPNFEVLSYRYGAGSFHTTSSDSAIRQFGRSHQGTGINGPMPLGDSLYVKWRNKTTGEVMERTVDLKPLLPSDMSHMRLHFVVGESELSIYLVEAIPRPKDWPAVGPKKFQYEKVRQIYPLLISIQPKSGD